MTKHPHRNPETETTTIECWLVFNAMRFDRMTLNEPKLFGNCGRYCRKVKISLTFPWSLFGQPKMEVSVVLEGEPDVVDPEEPMADIRRAVDWAPSVMVQPAARDPEG